ncbi:hypothetical protein COO60DRAFT_1516715 [Scenedesmus sp. NREL 46B-D3]|nr:hypothetical protein COO60DRAFT_1516715 [Scenedesmus sp. NREL 46B-D3]
MLACCLAQNQQGHTARSPATKQVNVCERWQCPLNKNGCGSTAQGATAAITIMLHPMHAKQYSACPRVMHHQAAPTCVPLITNKLHSRCVGRGMRRHPLLCHSYTVHTNTVHKVSWHNCCAIMTAELAVLRTPLKTGTCSEPSTKIAITRRKFHYLMFCMHACMRQTGPAASTSTAAGLEQPAATHGVYELTGMIHPTLQAPHRHPIISRSLVMPAPVEAQHTPRHTMLKTSMHLGTSCLFPKL